MGRAKPIMIQGTMSNAGKSLLAAGLCRVLSQDGLRVAPFKSQNMALNSGVTADGLEMGRAQIMQAEACGIAPDVRMNPILLKPESDHRSQLIVAGKAQGAFAARDYFARKKALMPQILEAFDSLAEENDVIVIEGAGSPVEINLAENDIVNMGLARAVSSPVLLVGDIDPGGVFAQLYGTVALFAPEDRALLRGLVVNKFRGDVEILRPGLAPLEKMCGVPVVGVVPYLTLDLDDEDSLAPRLSAREARGVIDVAVVRLPHLSNFTDFDPLSRVPGVGVRYVSSTTDLGRPDLVVLPGSKTTLDDVRWLAALGAEYAVITVAKDSPFQTLEDLISALKEDPTSVNFGGGSAIGGQDHMKVLVLAQEAGIDDVGIGALFGLYDWRFEVMGLLYHARELERALGIGPHTISFPRLEPAENTPFAQNTQHLVSDEDFEKAVVIIRLSVPYTGMIVTARENAAMRRRLIPLGCTQTDASSRIGVGAYQDEYKQQEGKRQQFLLGDTRSLDDLVRELAQMGYITSFCTAGYRCGRTGQCIMDLLRSGREGKFCKLNAVLTFREWLDDFASPETRAIGEVVLQKEIEEIRTKAPKGFNAFMKNYERTARGERDLYF